LFAQLKRLSTRAQRLTKVNGQANEMIFFSFFVVVGLSGSLTLVLALMRCGSTLMLVTTDLE